MSVSGETKCTCLPGFQGDRCQINLNECLAANCGPHGNEILLFLGPCVILEWICFS